MISKPYHLPFKGGLAVCVCVCVFLGSGKTATMWLTIIVQEEGHNSLSGGKPELLSSSNCCVFQAVCYLSSFIKWLMDSSPYLKQQ